MCLFCSCKIKNNLENQLFSKYDSGVTGILLEKLQVHPILIRMLSFLLSQAYTDVSEAVVVKPWGLTMSPGGEPKCVSKHLGNVSSCKV